MTEHWSDNEKLRRTFHVGLYLRLVKAHILTDDPRIRLQPWKDSNYNRCWGLIKEQLPIRETPDASTAIEKMVAWAIENIIEKPEHNSNVVNITVEVVRHYEMVSIKYGLSTDYRMSSLANITAAFNELRDICEAQHDLAASNEPALVTRSANQDAGAMATVEIYCHTLRLEFKNGKKQISLLGGDFSEFGIPVYDEYLEALNLNLEGLDYGDHEYKRNVLVQLNGNGKPKRALKCLEA